MKQFLLFVCCCLTSVVAMAQSEGQFKRTAPPSNAKELVKSIQPQKAPQGAQGQLVTLNTDNSVSEAQQAITNSTPTTTAERPMPNAANDPNKVVKIRKFKNLQTGETRREAVTQAQLDAENAQKPQPQLSLEQQRAKAKQQEK